MAIFDTEHGRGPIMPRRGFLAGTAAVAATAMTPSLAGAAVPPSGQIAFDVLRGGSSIGSHVLTFRQDGEDLLVDVAIDLRVRIALITAYRYTHRNTERWRDGRVVSIDTVTNDDGRDLQVTGRATDEGFVVDGSEGRLVAPPDILTTSYWQQGITQVDSALDTQNGIIRQFTVTEGPSELIDGNGGRIPGQRYRFDGDLNLDVWYSAQAEWVGLAFEVRGSAITYERVRQVGSILPPRTFA